MVAIDVRPWTVSCAADGNRLSGPAIDSAANAATESSVRVSDRFVCSTPRPNRLPDQRSFRLQMQRPNRLSESAISSSATHDVLPQNTELRLWRAVFLIFDGALRLTPNPVNLKRKFGNCPIR